MGELGFIVFVIFFVVFILIMRLLGAWMLRINDVISELKGLRRDLRALENNFNNYVPQNKIYEKQGLEFQKKGI